MYIFILRRSDIWDINCRGKMQNVSEHLETVMILFTHRRTNTATKLISIIRTYGHCMTISNVV